MSTTGIIDLASNHSVAETADRLETLLKAKGIKVFVRIDQAAEARAAGLTMRPTVLVIFGDPKAGTPLMELVVIIPRCMDLPLHSALVWGVGGRQGVVELQTARSFCSNVMVWTRAAVWRALVICLKWRRNRSREAGADKVLQNYTSVSFFAL